MGLRPFVVFVCVATKASNSATEFVDVLLGDSFRIRASSDDSGRIGIGSTGGSGLSTAHLPSAIFQCTSFVSHLL